MEIKINGIKGLTLDYIREDVASGGKFVYFTYCISLIVLTWRYPTSTYYVRSRESVIKYGWKYLLTNLVLGWWGVPWGPVYTISGIVDAFLGKDITRDIMERLEVQYAADHPITDSERLDQLT